MEGRGLRICFASRYYPNITIRFLEEIRLDEQPEHTQDISIYLEDRIRRLNIPDVRLRDMLASEIKRRSSGIFLWVVLVVRKLKKEVDHGVAHTRLLAILEAVPTKIQDLLADILQRSDKALLAALQWVLCAKRPLSCGRLYAYIHISNGEPTLASGGLSEVSDEIKGNYILTASRGLIEITRNGFEYAQFVHESVREYLLRDGLTSIDKTLNGNVVGLSNARLARWIQAYVESEMAAKTWQERANAVRTRHPIGYQFVASSSFLICARNALFFHLDIAYRNGALDLASLQEFEIWGMLEGPAGQKVHSSAVLAFMFMKSWREGIAEALLTASIPHVNPECRHEVTAYPSSAANDVSWWRYDPEAAYGEFVSLLFTAIHRGYHGIAAILLKHGANVNSVDTFQDDSRSASHKWGPGLPADRDGGDSPLTSVAGRGRDGMVKLLLDKGARVDHRDNQGRTALMKLANRSPNSTDDAVLLLAAGADVNAWTPEFGTALHLACQARQLHSALVLLLLDRGADVNKRRGGGQTVLHIASGRGLYELAKLFLENGADKNLSSISGTPLGAACRWGHMNVVRLLLDEGAEVNAHCGEYGSALVAAVIWGNGSIVKLLLDHGADPNARISWKYGTPLGVANIMYFEGVSEILRAYGADPDRLAVPSCLFKVK